MLRLLRVGLSKSGVLRPRAGKTGLCSNQGAKKAYRPFNFTMVPFRNRSKRHSISHGPFKEQVQTKTFKYGNPEPRPRDEAVCSTSDDLEQNKAAGDHVSTSCRPPRIEG